MINGQGQSDGEIVPEKSPNNSQEAEGMEGRSPAKGNAQEHPSHRTQSRAEGMQVVLERIRKAVKRDEKVKLTALYQHVYNVDHLKAAYYQLKKKAAAGADGETWQHYGQELEANLENLSGRLRRGAYRCASLTGKMYKGESPSIRRFSEPEWPQVMRRSQQWLRRSVDRGTSRSGIELRNPLNFGVLT
jgi:hypothetical protein